MDYRLKPVGRTCAATGQDLRPGTVCHSALVERDGRFVRLDFSEEGWTGPPEGTIGHWRCLVPEPEPSGPRPPDTEALMRYFEQLCEDENPATETFRYILALLLLQKRRLEIEDSRCEGDTEYLKFVGRRGEGPFWVRDHHLSDEEIGRLQRDLHAHLTAEWS